MGKKTYGVTSTKRPKRAGNINRMSDTTGHAWHLKSDADVTVSPATQKKDELVTMMRDLSIRIKGTEDHLRGVKVFPSLSQATAPVTRRRARPRVTSTET